MQSGQNTKNSFYPMTLIWHGMKNFNLAGKQRLQKKNVIANCEWVKINLAHQNNCT